MDLLGNRQTSIILQLLVKKSAESPYIGVYYRDDEKKKFIHVPRYACGRSSIGIASYPNQSIVG